jgi:iron complex transport system ATP-binding protein
LGRKKNIPALIYVTHHVEEILPFFRKTLVLRNGKILHNGETRQILQDDLLKRLYGVSLTLLRKKRRHWPIVK